MADNKYPKELPETSDLVRNQFLDSMIGDKRTDEAIEPVSSPIDLMAGAAGAKLGSAMAQDAAAILGNEIGSIGASIPEGYEAGSAGNIQRTQQFLKEIGRPHTPGATPLADAESHLRNVEGAIEQGVRGIGESERQFATQRVMRLKNKSYADGGEVSSPPEFISDDQAKQFNPQPVQVQGTPEFIPDHLFKSDEDRLQEKYGTPTEMAKTAVEGAAQGLAGPLAPLAERALGIDPEEIRARAEANPLTHYGSELAGLAGGLLTGSGEAALAAKGGGLAAKALGLADEAGAVAKVGSAALKGAIENMTIQSGDELSKMVLLDPAQTSETALTDIGLAGVLGSVIAGGATAVSPLWKATIGKDTHHLLDSLVNKLGGIEGTEADSINAAIKNSGLEVSPEIRSALSSDPAARQAFQLLQESASTSGMKAQQALRDFKGVASDAMVRALGKTPEELASLSDLSEFDAGTEVKKHLVDALKTNMDPISERFNMIRERFKGEELGLNAPSRMADQIATLVKDEGYNLSPSSPQSKIISDTIKELPNVNTLEDLRKYQSILADKTFANPELRRVGGQLRNILRDAEEEAVMDIAGEKASALIEEHKAARAAYRDAMSVIDKLNDRLHVGKFSGPSSFIKALGEMAPEDVLRRLSPKNDAALIGELSQFPAASEAVRDHYLSKILKTASSKAGEGEHLSIKTLFSALDKMSPEMRNFVVPEGMANKLNAIKSLVDALPSKLNSSGTAKTLDLLWSHMPTSGGALAALLHGHNPIIGALLGHVGKLVGREVPDAVRLSMLKFLGSNKTIDAAGFKAMTDYMVSAARGEKMITKAVKSVFAVKAPLPAYQTASNKDLEKLDKRLQDLQKDPQKLYESNGDLAHYMPEHDQALAQNISNITSVLNLARPAPKPENPLDRPMPVTKQQKADYNRLLSIAQNPLSVLDHVKRGTITPTDIAGMSMMYPSLYKRLVTDLNNHMIDVISKGEIIPYQTRMGMSMFMAKSLDTTLTPEGIRNAQPEQLQDQAQQAMMKAPKGVKSSPALQKMPNAYRTPGESRAMRMQRLK